MNSWNYRYILTVIWLQYVYFYHDEFFTLTITPSRNVSSSHENKNTDKNKNIYLILS